MPDLPPLSEARPRDFRGRTTRGKRARGFSADQRRKHLGRRIAIATAVVTVPAFAAPDDWAMSASDQVAIANPMPFETPGESFPGSAFYYLADTPDLPVGNGAVNAPTAGQANDGHLALAAADARQLDAGPAARMMLATGSITDKLRAQQCLTQAIYYEAATESDAGQRAVAQVVLNRVAHPSYPNTVCGVVFQGSERQTGCQFSFTCDGAMARRPSPMWWDRAARIAREALAGSVYRPIGLATHYHTIQIHPYWADSLDHVGTIGAHRFYRWRGAAGRAAAFSNRYVGHEPIPAPHPRTVTASAAPDYDPLALARAYEEALQAAQKAAPTSAPNAVDPAPSYAPAVEARGGDDLFTGQNLPASGGVRDEYARSGQWIAQP
ncbi:cell wall hydrolase [Croceibacterium xixiisoli]|uniref:cell wall hydrolase n=1 Tax=Croceibacterium xixiisoli TaxID=1476466 RepID=UPI00361985D3